MKTKLVFAFGCLGLLLSASLFAACPNQQCGQRYAEPSSCSSESGLNCQCTDPGCYDRGNDCLSRGRCCRAFGNVGAFD